MNEGYRRKKKLFNDQGRAQLEKLLVVPGLGGAGKNYWNCRTNWTKDCRLTTVVEQDANQRSEAVGSRCWRRQTALSVVEFDDADHAGFHHRARLFSWDAPRDGSGPRHCRNDDREPPTKRPLCGLDWVTLGSWSHDYDFRCRFGHHLVRSRNSAKNWPDHGIVCWPHVNSSGNSKSVWNYALDYGNIYAFAVG